MVGVVVVRGRDPALAPGVTGLPRMAVKAEGLWSRIFAAGFAVFFTMALPNRIPAHAAPLIRVTDGVALCLDSMETEPFDDDQEAMPIAATIDGGCLVPDRAVSA